MDFENFCKNQENVNKAKSMENKIDVNFEEIVNKYKGKSNSELYADLLRLASQEKAKGNLSKNQLDNIYNTLAPMMSEKEKENLKNLLNMIG